MLKVRIIAALLAVLLTIGTVYTVPWIVYVYKHWVAQMTAGQQQLFNIAQVVIGLLIAVFGYWCWKKKRSQPKP